MTNPEAPGRAQVQNHCSGEILKHLFSTYLVLRTIP